MIYKVLIDTNVLVDYTLNRIPFSDDANEIIELCLREKIKGCIAAHTITDMYYILRKDIEPHKRREILINYCEIFDVIDIGKSKLLHGLINEAFPDFEDCLQTECAMEYGSDFIVTRNTDDFKKSVVKAITPKEFLKLIKLG